MQVGGDLVGGQSFRDGFPFRFREQHLFHLAIPNGQRDDRGKMFFIARFGQIHNAFPLSETLMGAICGSHREQSVAQGVGSRMRGDFSRTLLDLRIRH